MVNTTVNGVRNHSDMADTDTDKRTGTGNPEHESRKRRLLEGPDDIVPDFNLEKAKPYKRLKKKRGVRKKTGKPLLVSDDESVKEAMSESEEQLAKLRLDCTSDAETIIPGMEEDVEDKKEVPEELHEECRFNDDKQGPGQDGDGGVEMNECSVTDAGHADGLVCDNAGMKDMNGEHEVVVDTNTDSSKPSSSQTSPGSIHLSMFQPLVIATEDSENERNSNSSAQDNPYDFKSEQTTPVEGTPAKRQKGRPKGSKNKPKREPKKNQSETNGDMPPGSRLENQSTSGTVQSESSSGINESDSGKSTAATDNGMPTTSCSVSKTGEIKVEKAKRKYVRKKKLVTENPSEQTAKRSKKTEVIETMGPKVPDTCLDRMAEVSSETASNKENASDHETDCSSKGIGVANHDRDLYENVSTDNNDSCKVNIKPSLLENITPLYGETPNVNESNQGLPSSPAMDTSSKPSNGNISNKVCEDINATVKNCEINNTDIPTFSNFNNLQMNGPLMGKPQLDIDHRPTMLFSGLQPAYFGFNRGIMDMNLFRPDVSAAHFAFRNNLAMSVPMSVPSSLCIMGGFAQPVINAHAQFSHMTNVVNGNNVHVSCDQNHDQPLDLTNGLQKEEFTKGKIFKTKILKKVQPKSESTAIKDKSNN